MSAKPQEIKASQGWTPIYQAHRQDGAVIIKGLLSTDQVLSINQEVDEALGKHTAGSKLQDQFSRAFHGRNTKRLTNLVTLSRTFRLAVLENELMHRLCEEVFTRDSGSYWLGSAACIDIGPRSEAQPLHRDQFQFPVFARFAGPDAPEASVNFIVALSEFREENGATRVLVGSHRWPDFADDGEDVVDDNTVPAEMEPGDAVFISSKILHGGGANVTDDVWRRGLSLVFQCSYLTPEEASPFLVDKELARSLSPRAQRMLGFRCQFPRDCPGLWKLDYGDVGDGLHC
ncbi:hypothetical protein CP532_0398 [Ophiocordyceps camponoti-leonardi (nom. inval.)]|nr:hypothetical protein CP532_0398 [Ophiocordyceps camponoti-leonardi (nom. inval.)]